MNTVVGRGQDISYQIGPDGDYGWYLGNMRIPDPPNVVMQKN